MECLWCMQCFRRTFGYCYFVHSPVVYLCVLSYLRLTDCPVYDLSVCDEYKTLCLEASPQPGLVVEQDNVKFKIKGNVKLNPE